MKIKAFFNKLLAILFPKNATCAICGEDLVRDNGSGICEKSESNLPFIKGNICLICGEPLSCEGQVCSKCKARSQQKHRPFLIARASFEFKDEIAKLIHSFKYDNAKYLASTFAYYLNKTYMEMNFKADIIAYIPLNIKKQKLRGYNQSELLAINLGKLIDVKVDKGSLERVEDTKSQTKLNYAQRQENLKNAFKVINKNAFKNKKILLIDDVYTTGATTKYASIKIMECGAKQIAVLTIAHTVFKNDSAI